MRVHRSLFAVLPLLVAAACTTKKEAPLTDTVAAGAAAIAPATDEGAVRRAIDSANARMLDAMKRGDTATAAANYASDAVVMNPNVPALRGADAVKKGIVGYLSQTSIKDAKATTEDVMVRGDLAIETGRFEWTVVPKGGKEMIDKGKYLTVWKRQADGSWKVVRDINNSDQPAKM